MAVAKSLHVLSALVAGAVALAGATVAPEVRADYPEKPVTLVVPYKAGGSTETMARLYSKALAAELGTKVIVRTRPGGGGAVGATEVAASAPDGYTLLFAATASLLWPPMTQKVEFDLESFTYVGQITEYQQAIVAKADAPFDTLQELVAHAKTNSLNYADQSAMSRAYIDFIGSTEGVNWTGIPTKGGGEMVPFLLGGKIDFAWSGGIHNRYGEDMKVLASMNGTRLLASPDIPSIAELYGIAMPSQAVIVVPKGTPAEIVATLEAAVEKATKDADFADLVTNKLKFPVKFVGSQALSADIAETVSGLKTVVEKTQ
ncbi:MAG: tripartite tricarboxylate transporter substrate binding protein [Kiloniellales bacterium]|nr:tripartite tricarboxylate transporter substrate binding protein [Kiloniellales bacterium]